MRPYMNTIYEAKQEYFYIIEHNKSGMRYAGSRYSKFANPNEFWNPNHKHPYFTSSKIIKDICETEGYDSFTILKLKTVQDARSYEYRFLRKINAAKNPMWFNKHNGGAYFKYTKNKKLTEEHKRNISKGLIGRIQSDDTKEKIRLGNIGKICTAESKEKMKLAWKTRKPMSEETKLKMSISRRGIPGNKSFLGKTHTDETKRKMREAQLGKPKSKIACPHCHLLAAPAQAKRWHFDNCKFKL